MTLTRISTAAILTPEQVGALVVQPLIEQSTALQAATVVPVDNSSLRVPVVTADPTAAWTAEGAEITPSDGTVAEVDITFSALKGLTIITSELAEDSSPAAAQVVGDGLVRDLRRQVDLAFFSAATTAPANTPAGLGTLPVTGGNKINVLAGGTITTLDAFSDAVLNAESFYVNPADLTFVAAPATLGALLKLKEATGSARPLIAPDVTQPSRRTVGGVPIVSSPAVAAGVVWCIPRPRVIVGMRKDAELKIDASAYFSSDRVGIRVVLRLGWGFVHNAAITKITLS
ncbi:MAG: phage major capsid protein [Janthinobacterium lividum]